MSLKTQLEYKKRGGYSYCKKYQDKWRKKNKEKVKGYINKWRKKNKEKVVKISMKSLKKRYAEWKDYFVKKYGENPACEICGKLLQWYKKNGTKDVVYFDHESKTAFIKRTPSDWYRGHPCTEKNINKLEKAIKGLLCCRCNHYLPTKNRSQWLKQVTNYILK